MLLKLAIQNLKSHRIRSTLMILSVLIGTATLFTFLSLDQGIKEASFQEIQSQIALNQITVRPKVEKAGIASFLSSSNKGKISQESIEQISAIPGVETIHPEIHYANFSSIEASILGISLQTDLMVFGLDEEFLEVDPKTWQKSTEPYPTLLPRKFLDLYNFAIAGPQGLPQFTEEQLIGRRITLYPNYSTFFPSQGNRDFKVELEVVGFSDKINLIGITLPYQLVDRLNKEQAGVEQSDYIELFVETEDPAQVEAVATEIETLGFSTNYLQKDFQNIESKFVYFRTALSIIGIVIWLSVSISILGIFLSSVVERKKEIGLLRAIGAKKQDIRSMILREALIIGLVGSFLGVVIGQISIKILNKITISQFPSTTFLPDAIFVSNIGIFITSLVFGILMSQLAALLPAHRATHIDIVQALKG